MPRAIGCDVSLWKVGPETNYRYDVDALERLITPKTKLIIVNTPHNPTGAMLSPADAARAAGFAARAAGRAAGPMRRPRVGDVHWNSAGARARARVI